MPASETPSPGDIPTTIGSQFIRQIPRYGVGLLLLAAYQYGQFWFDTRLMRAINHSIAGELHAATMLGVGLVSVAVGSFVLRVMSRVAVFNGGRVAEYELRRALLDRLQKLGPSFYRKMSTGEIMSRVTNDLTQVRLLLGFGILNVINTLFALVSALSVTLSMSPKLTFAALATLPVLLVVTRHFSRQIYTRQKDYQDALGRISEVVQSSIAGVRVVRSFSIEKQEGERFEVINQDYIEKTLALARLRSLMAPIMQAIATVGILVVFWYGGHLMLKGELSAGAFLAFYRALARLTWPLIALGFLVGLVQRGRASYARLKEVFDAIPDIADGPLPAPKSVAGRLEVKHLAFAYNGNRVLDDVSFELPPGGSLAIVGRTGSGKSTLAVLMPRLQPTPKGSVFIDGKDICELPLSTVRSTIGYAQQTAFLFSTTIGRNVGYALDEPDSDRGLLTVREAAREARILDEILALPDGFDTVVGERGVQLSGGQKQRTALARAFVSDPKVLVLDDPLSAVDARTERAILEAIDRQRAQRGVVLITHRVAAAARCDQILVLDEGKVVDRGTHDELVARGGLYAIFAEEQRIERELERLGIEELPAVEPAGRNRMNRADIPSSDPKAASAASSVDQAETVGRAGAAGAQRTEAVLKAFHEESALGKAYDWKLIKRLVPFFTPHRKLAYFSLVAILITAAGSLMRPLIMLKTIDQGVIAGNSKVLMTGGIVLGIVILFEQLLNYVQIYALQILGARGVADLRRHVFATIHRLRVGFFDRQPVGRLVTRVTNDSDAILDLFASGALSAVGDLVRLVGIVALMLAVDWQLSLITFAATPLAFLLVLGLRGRMREAYREIRAKTARMNATMNEQVAGMAVVQAFRREDQAGKEFDTINSAYRDANIASIKYEAMQDAAIEMLTAVCLASIIVALGYHRVSFGTVVAFNAYVVQFFEPISALALRYTLLQSAMAGAERIFGLLDSTENELDAPKRDADQVAPRGDSSAAIELDQVSFEYKPGVPVLRDVTFRAKRGEKIALVGPTGAGKSTIAQLLLRLYDVQRGVVRIDGDDVTGLAREDLRRRFSVVPQDVFLFPGTVLGNIAAGEEPDRARARQALERMGALDLFERREDGLDARVDEHGANFSAGERQLIAFARALYRDAPILILDEATASIDSDTESRLQRALEELMKGRTAVIIAHRLSTIRKADRIVVFHKGKVVEQGSHEELLELGGLYAKLHELQFARSERVIEAAG